jgi:hypothetical protein
MFQNRQGLDPALRFVMARRSRLGAASISAKRGLHDKLQIIIHF